MRDVLEDEGYRVVTAADGREGLERVAAERPDLALVDLMMPIVDGREMIRALRSNPDHRHLPVILMSAVYRAETRVEGGEVVEFLRKPFSLEKLLDVIRRLIGPGIRQPKA